MITLVSRFLRTGLLLSLSLTALAVAAARVAGPESQRRFPDQPTLAVAQPQAVGLKPGHLNLLDPDTGESVVVPLPPTMIMDSVAISPFVDDLGRAQAVGRYRVYDGTGADRLIGEVGLLRLSIPDGRILNREPMETLPFTPPSFEPGTRACVVYASGDGQIHRVDFDEAEETGRPLVSQPLPWRVADPPKNQVHIMEIVRPQHPRLRRIGIATLCLELLDKNQPRPQAATNRDGGLKDAADSTRKLGPSKLWWVEFSETNDAIVAAGRIGVPNGDAATATRHERNPIVVNGAAGEPRLVFQIRERGWDAARLVEIPLVFPNASGRPRFQTGEERVVMSATARWTPAVISRDGQRVWLDPSTPSVPIALNRSQPSAASSPSEVVSLPSLTPRMVPHSALSLMAQGRMLFDSLSTIR